MTGSRIRAEIGSLLDRWKKLLAAERKKAYLLAGAAGGGIVLLFLLLVLTVRVDGGEEARETEVTRGRLTVGVTESGTVSLGTSEQTFDLDISEYTGESSISWEAGGMGGEGMAQIFRQAAGSSSAGGSRALKVEEVYVTAGEEVEKGDPILKLENDSVESIREELSEDAADAKITWEQLLTGGKQTKLEAKASLAANILYGSAAQAEYDSTLHSLEASVQEAEERLAEKEEALAEKTQELEEMNALLTEQKEVLSNAEYARDNTDRVSSLYWWITAVNTADDTRELAEELEQEIETAQKETEQYSSEISSLRIALSLAEKELELGKSEAEKQLTLRQFNEKNAQEIYDVAVERSDFETENAGMDYEEATQKLADFDDMITDGVIASAYTGVITAVGVGAGDSLAQDGSLITLNDYEEATITVDVDENDMDSAAKGSGVNISFTAFPDEVMKGEVSEVGDAQINSNTNRTTYSVTVAVKGDATRLYEGMNAEVTFITKESEEVLKVSNRAILREDGTSFVKMKNDGGRIVKKEVTTGFSDGIEVEIKEGLSEGDIVLIESGA